jgi:hypothetical protein
VKSHPFRTNLASSKLRWRELPPRADEPLINAANSYVRQYTLGECTVLVTRESGRWHLSIAHRLRYPTWDEVAEARYRAIPDDVWMALHLPPRGEYVDLHPNCFQLIQAAAPGEGS